MRPYEVADEGEVLGLINANIVPDQPRVSAAMLASALSGRSPIDSSFWSELGDIATIVMRVPASSAPRSTSASARDVVRFQTVTRWPLSRRRRPSPVPWVRGR